MRRLKFITVCGFGVGSSLILKMQLDDVLAERGTKADVTPCDVTSAMGEPCDLIFTSHEFGDQIRAAVNVPVVEVQDFLDKENLMRITDDALKKYLSI